MLQCQMQEERVPSTGLAVMTTSSVASGRAIENLMIADFCLPNNERNLDSACGKQVRQGK